MSVIVEDGSNIQNANSYVSEDDFTAYMDARGESYDGSNVTSLLISAMDYIESYTFSNDPTYSDQALSFPRNKDEFIPNEIKKAQLILARNAINIDIMPNPTSDKVITSETQEVSDAVTVSYTYANSGINSDGSISTSQKRLRFQEVDKLLRKYKSSNNFLVRS